LVDISTDTSGRPSREHTIAAIFEHVREAGGLVFVSGQTPMLPDGRVPEGVSAQADVVVEKLRSALGSVGRSLVAIAKVTYFLTDIADLPDLRTALDAALPVPRPDASLVEVSGLIDPRFRIEIEAIAVRG
jgi:2-iminobutanoate/2-iminopropanoate deaminase